MEIVKLPLSKWKSYKNLRLKALKEEPQAFGASFDENSKYSDNEWKRRLNNALEGKNNWLFFAKENDKLFGMIGAYLEKGVEDVATLISMFVSKEQRGRGVSRALMEKLLLELSKNNSLKKVKLTVNIIQKPAISLYESFGFKKKGTQKFRMGDDKIADEFRMERALPYLKRN